MIAEDSVLLEKMLCDLLKKAGYNKLMIVENGCEAYDVVCQCKAGGTLNTWVNCIITDIEVPRMDGLSLIKLLKSDEATAHIPIVVFTSRLNEEMRKTAENLGVDAFLTKSEMGIMVKTLDHLLLDMNLK